MNLGFNPLRSLGSAGVLFVLMAACGGRDAAPTTTGSCQAGSLRCACFPNSTCNDGLSCLSGICVEHAGSSGLPGGPAAPASSGTASSGSVTGTSGLPLGASGVPVGSSGAPVGASGTVVHPGVPGGSGVGGGVASGGTAGSDVPRGTTGSTGQTSSGGTTSGATGSQTPTVDTCNNAPTTTVDNFYTCDTAICNVAGRSGSWYHWGSNGLNVWFDVTNNPPSGWKNRACGAFISGGVMPSGDVSTAGMGLSLADGNAYDLSGYRGLVLDLESGVDLYFLVKTLGGGYFGTAVPATDGGYTIDFADLAPAANSKELFLDLHDVVDLQLSPAHPEDGFGYAIHSVILRR